MAEAQPAPAFENATDVLGKEIAWTEPTATETPVVNDDETATEDEAEAIEEAPAEEAVEPGTNGEAEAEKVAAAEETPAAEEPAETPREKALRLDLEQIKTKLELQMEHNARLSGTIGNLTKKARQAPHEDREVEEVDRETIEGVNNRLDEFERSSKSDAVRDAVRGEVEAFDRQKEFEGLRATDSFKALVTKYTEDFNAALAHDDPAKARRLTNLAIKALVAEAEADVERADRAKALEIKAAQKAKTLATKKAGGKPSGAAGKTAAASAPKVDWNDPDSIAAHYKAIGRPGW